MVRFMAELLLLLVMFGDSLLFFLVFLRENVEFHECRESTTDGHFSRKPRSFGWDTTDAFTQHDAQVQL